jgi:type II secretory pathway component GspD/PulD (secretin)
VFKQLLLVIVLTLPLKAFAADIKLIDASLGAAAAYFSQLTGNSYTVQFKTDAKISIVRDDLSEATDIHDIFSHLVVDLGGKIEEMGTNRYVIKDPASGISDNAIVSVESDMAVDSLVRLDLERRISKPGIRDLIANIDSLNSFIVLSDDLSDDSVLLSGPADKIKKIQKMVGSLKALPPKQIPIISKADENVVIASKDIQMEPSIEENIMVVVDLSFADSQELVEAIKALMGGTTIGQDLNISAHASANQVILSGSQSGVKQVLETINQLDRAPRQVYVDAIIAEISEDTTKRLGLQFSVNNGNLSASLVSGVTGLNIGSLANDQFLATAAGGVLAAGAGANSVPDIGVMLAALQGDSDNRILATPSLMTTENTESSILVGQNVPFITGTYSNQSGDASSPFQTIKREDLGTILKLKPKIGLDGNILMEIWQEISRIDTSATGLSDVATVKRQISTVVSANEGETIAIGGLRIEQQEINVSKVPVLGDLPVFGNLFRQETTKSVSRNLAIFLRPTIVTANKQRLKIVKSWSEKMGDKLFEYSDEKTKFFDPEPIGPKSDIKMLRPFKKPVVQ